MNIEGKNPVCLVFHAVINHITTPVLESAVAQCVTDNKHDEIHLMISTGGGSVADGITAYNFLRTIPATIKTYNIGTVDSIGNVLFMAGKRRFASSVSRFMFHGVAFDIQSARMELKDIRERLGNIENDQSMIADILAEHTNMTKEKISNLFLEAAFLSATEAKKNGIVHEVRDITLPTDMPVVPLVFQG